MSDAVNNPSHYRNPSNDIEVIDVIELWNLGFSIGNVVKYLLRGGKKPIVGCGVEESSLKAKIQDFKKAQWYLNREISNLEMELLESEYRKEKLS